jgi:hypothetical protein
MRKLNTRREFLCIAGLGLFSLSLCTAGKASVLADVVLFSYLSRPIYDVRLGNAHLGGSNVYPYTGGSTMSGLALRLGPQTVQWKLDGPDGLVDNGRTVVSRNTPVLQKPAPGMVFLAVHIYPSDEVELFFSKHYPAATEKGKAVVKAIPGNGPGYEM